MAMRGGVESINREFRRVVAENHELFGRSPENADDKCRTVFGYIRQIPKREESRKQAKKQIVDLRMFLNQCKINVTTEELRNMDGEEMMMMYENVIKQKNAEYIEYKKMEKQMKR